MIQHKKLIDCPRRYPEDSYCSFHLRQCEPNEQLTCQEYNRILIKRGYISNPPKQPNPYFCGSLDIETLRRLNL